MEMNKVSSLFSSLRLNSERGKRLLYLVAVVLVTVGLIFASHGTAFAADISIDLGTDGTEGAMGSMQLLFLFTLLAVGPSLLIMMTSFTRIVIVFSFLRSAMGLQQTPPNQVIIGLALFLSLFIMQPTLNEIQTNSLQPYMENQITQGVAMEEFQKPLKTFMLKQIKAADLNLFLTLAGEEEQLQEINPENLVGLGMEVIVPSFITSELKRAFTMGFLLFLPFLVIDMIVSSTLMSMGMVMLPPSMISMPFKLMLFVVVDGWSLIMEMLVKSFY